MKHVDPNEHLSAQRLQAFLEGDLSRRERSRIEEHLAVCADCSVEHDGWKVLFEDLGDLPSLRPTPDFAERVMAGVRAPAALPLAARLRRGLVGAPSSEHLDEGLVQDFLDGVLTGRRARAVETHLAACSDCTAEADAWFALMGRLEGLERLAPNPDFSRRVMAGVNALAPSAAPSLGARWLSAARSALGALRPRSVSEHMAAGVLQDLADGTLPALATARARAHLDGCRTCSAEAAGWQALCAHLLALERYAPTEGFADRVMAHVRVPAAAAHAATVAAPARTPAWAPLLAAARRLVPQTREAWAALSGVAVTPAVTVALVFYAVFSHPTLTLEGLAAFAWWQVTDLAAAAWTVVAATAVDSAQLFGVYSLFSTLASAPLLLAAGAVAYAVVCGLALRVLYKNLFANRPVNGRYAHASAS